MVLANYKEFSERLIEAMKANGYTASRSPNGICMHTLATFADASEQICRRYIRGEALPCYEKVIAIAHHLQVSPGWLLFGEDSSPEMNPIDDSLLHYILKRSHHLYREETNQTDDYADFVVELLRDIREIEASKENLEKIIDLAIGSISSFKQKQKKKAI